MTARSGTRQAAYCLAGKQADNRQASADRQTPTSSRGGEGFEGVGRVWEWRGMTRFYLQDRELRNATAVMATRDSNLPSKPQLLSPPDTKVVCCPNFQFKAS